MTPDEKSRAFAPEEWIVDGDPIRVLFIVPSEADGHTPCPPPYDQDAEPRRHRGDTFFFWFGTICFYGLLGVVTWWLVTGRTL